MTNYLGEESSLQVEYTLAGRPFRQVVTRLDSLLMVLKSCYAKECHLPWGTLHPYDNKVNNLKHALDPVFDAFYEAQPKVTYSSCELGYLLDAEGPQNVNAFGEEQDELHVMTDQQPEGGRRQTFKYAGELSWWT